MNSIVFQQQSAPCQSKHPSRAPAKEHPGRWPLNYHLVFVFRSQSVRVRGIQRLLRVAISSHNRSDDVVDHLPTSVDQHIVELARKITCPLRQRKRTGRLLSPSSLKVGLPVRSGPEGSGCVPEAVGYCSLLLLPPIGQCFQHPV